MSGCVMGTTCEGRCLGEFGECVAVDIDCKEGWSSVDCEVCAEDVYGAACSVSRCVMGTTCERRCLGDSGECVAVDID